MKIFATQYSLSTRSFEIFVSGCRKPHCRNCYNPDTWDFNRGELYTPSYFNKKILPKVTEFSNLVHNIFILGGEPLDQEPADLNRLLLDLQVLEKPIWLFTKYDFDQIPRRVLCLVDYVKCGRYIEEFKTDNNVQYGIRLATNNQKIYKKGVDYFGRHYDYKKL